MTKNIEYLDLLQYEIIAYAPIIDNTFEQFQMRNIFATIQQTIENQFEYLKESLTEHIKIDMIIFDSIYAYAQIVTMTIKDIACLNRLGLRECRISIHLINKNTLYINLYLNHGSRHFTLFKK
jgi:hypothetical protein